MITQHEGDPLSGGAVHTYTLVRHGDTSGTTTADWQVKYSGFSDPASDADFVNGLRPQGQVTFAPGVTQVDIDVIVSGDLEVEGDESFSIVVTGVSGAGVALVDPARSSRRGIILEDESPVTVIDEVQFRWRQIRHGGGTRDVWAIDNVSLSDSGFADDFDPDIENSQWASIQNGAVNGNGSIFPGSNGQELLMSGTGDRIATSVAATPISGAVLTFDLIIGNGTESSGNGADNAESGKDVWLEYSVDGQYWDVLKKMDTDDYEQWSTVNVTLPDRTAVTPKVIDEGDSGTTSMTLNLVRTGNLSKPATADWLLLPTGTSAIDIDDLDGTAFPSGTVDFGVDDGVEAVTIPIRGDTAFESAETFELVVTGTTGGPITGGPRVATILNDDALGVDGVELNDGSAQRSKVTEVHVRFNALVDASASAFSLTNLGTPQQPQNVPVTDLAITFADVGASTVATIRRTTGQSLADGEYRLDIDGSTINVRGGSILMGSGYAFGDQAADNFFCKYGDNDGNARSTCSTLPTSAAPLADLLAMQDTSTRSISTRTRPSICSTSPPSAQALAPDHRPDWSQDFVEEASGDVRQQGWQLIVSDDESSVNRRNDRILANPATPNPGSTASIGQYCGNDRRGGLDPIDPLAETHADEARLSGEL